MRVISGTARGCRLKAPQGLDTRPTGDRIKEALFSMIAQDLPGCNFLDVFSGTGAIAIEALSRGAASAVLIETSPVSCEIIKENLEAARLTSGAALLAEDYRAGLKRLEGRKFDIIFMDPPYYKELVPEALRLIIDHKLLAEDGYIVIECGAGEDKLSDYPGLTLFKTKEYKTTSILFLQERVE